MAQFVICAAEHECGARTIYQGKGGLIQINLTLIFYFCRTMGQITNLKFFTLG